MAPNSCSPTWSQPSVDGKFVYVACNKSDEIVEVERASWRITRRFATGRGVYNLAVTPDGRMLVATLKQGAGIQIFDLAKGASVAQLKTSTTVAHGVTISSDSRYAFVSSEGVGAAPGKVDVVDLRARRIVGHRRCGAAGERHCVLEVGVGGAVGGRSGLRRGAERVHHCDALRSGSPARRSSTHGAEAARARPRLQPLHRW
jgi:hypothetical protein